MQNETHKFQPEIGLVQWFAIGERDKVEQAVRDIRELKVKHLRTLFSWAEWTMEGGPAWFDWFVAKLAEEGGVELFPSLFYTPPSLAQTDRSGVARTSHPPKVLSWYADFLKEMIKLYGKYFHWVQLWNEPNWTVYWNDKLDPNFCVFAEMAAQAAQAAHALGKQTVLGGMTPYEPGFVTRMSEYGLLQHLDAISFHYAPSWPPKRRWFGWETELKNARALLAGHNSQAQVWIGETGLSTRERGRKHDSERLQDEQISYFRQLTEVPAQRMYWHSLYDQPLGRPTDDAINLQVQADDVAYHFGIKHADYSPKKLFLYWKNFSGKS